MAAERGLEAMGVSVDQRFAELPLTGEVVVQCGFGDAEFGGDVGVADAIEASNLDQTLGRIERPFSSVGTGAVVEFHLAIVRSDSKPLTYLLTSK